MIKSFFTITAYINAAEDITFILGGSTMSTFGDVKILAVVNF